ncbi:MAG: ATP-dependent helicase [candidate division Zixibacteria bacterium]|nr:ATP-dependent helicase [candidate division Zixibacteria bacterium]
MIKGDVVGNTGGQGCGLWSTKLIAMFEYNGDIEISNKLRGNMPDFEWTVEQQLILNHDSNRHARILAGPGTGKSTVMVALLGRMRQSNPDIRIKMLTFTRAATAELALKVEEDELTVPTPSTVHSFSISVLLRNPGTGGFPEPLRIPDSWERMNVIRSSLAAKCGVYVRTLDKLINEMAANWEALGDDLNEALSEDVRNRFRGAWAVHREVLGYTLLEELPFALNRALSQHGNLPGTDYNLLLVDEYQDLNACDLSILRQLSRERRCSIIATGDDDQSIYSWRKAAPQGIRRFPQDYVPSDDYPLTVTLRCGRRIINWANYVIAQDPDRPLSRLPLSCKDDAPEGEVALLSFTDNHAEVRGVASLVKYLVDRRNVPPSEILILLRSDYNSTFSRPIRERLQQLGIEPSDPNYIVDIMSEPDNRKFLEVLRLLTREDDPISWASLLELTKDIGNTFINGLFERAIQNGSRFGRQLLTEYENNFPDSRTRQRTLANELVGSIVDWLRQQDMPGVRPDEGWLAYIDSLAGSSVLPQPTDEFREVLTALDEASDSDQTLAQFLAQIEPQGKDLAQAKSDGVRIMTMTGAKGLTVKATVVAGVEDGLVPRPGGDMAEERRVLYVAMTRSREFLYCTWAQRRTGPTARAGSGALASRLHSNFLNSGPVSSQDGRLFLRRSDS